MSRAAARPWPTYPPRSANSRPATYAAAASPLPWKLWDHQVRRIDELEDVCRATGRSYQGWAIDAGGSYAVDVLRLGAEPRDAERFTGRTFHAAFTAAIRGCRDAA